MKKLLSTLLISTIIGIFPASASVQQTNIPVQTVELAKKAIQEPIVCSKNPENPFCKTFEITPKPLELKSYLNQDYNAYEYTVSNPTQQFQIIKIDNAVTPCEAASRFKKGRFRLTSAITSIPVTAIGLPIIMVGLPFIPVALAPELSNEICKGNCTPKQSLVNNMVIVPAAVTGVIFLETITAPFVVTGVVGASTWHIAAAPYYYIKDKKNDKIANKEILTINNTNQTPNVSNGGSIKFTTLTRKKASSLKIYVKDPANPQIYILEK